MLLCLWLCKWSWNIFLEVEFESVVKGWLFVNKGCHFEFDGCFLNRMTENEDRHVYAFLSVQENRSLSVLPSFALYWPELNLPVHFQSCKLMTFWLFSFDLTSLFAQHSPKHLLKLKWTENTTNKIKTSDCFDVFVTLLLEARWQIHITNLYIVFLCKVMKCLCGYGAETAQSSGMVQ